MALLAEVTSHRRLFGGAPQSAPQPADFRTIYDEHSDFVHRVMLKLGASKSDCEDLVHDVFMVAFRKWGEFEHRAKVSTWLYSIAVRVVMAHRRKMKIRRFVGLDDAPEPADHKSPEKLMVSAQSSQVVHQVLERMSEKKRVVFVLFELEGLPGEEIAQIVDCPLKTVWTRLFHARKEFLSHLDDIGYTKEIHFASAEVDL